MPLASSRPAFGAPMLNRRHFIASATLAGVAAPAILRAEGGLFRDFPFSLGVAAGDPSSDGFVIWTRLAPEPMAPHGGMPSSDAPRVGTECVSTCRSRGSPHHEKKKKQT